MSNGEYYLCHLTQYHRRLFVGISVGIAQLCGTNSRKQELKVLASDKIRSWAINLFGLMIIVSGTNNNAGDIYKFIAQCKARNTSIRYVVIFLAVKHCPFRWREP